MFLTKEESTKYLERIRYTPTRRETQTELLRTIHRQHSYNIPFENLDVYCAKVGSVDPDKLYEKMVLRSRGGYCFEMNNLFVDAAEALGFEGYRVLARIGGKDRPYGALLHCLGIVKADGQKWICDVGYGGDGLIEPIAFDIGREQESCGRTFRVVPAEEMEFAVEVQKGGEFCRMFAFNDRPNLRKDFEIACFYTNCWPESGFRRRIMVTRPTPTGRNSLNDYHVKLSENGVMTEYDIDDSMLASTLKKYFDIEL